MITAVDTNILLDILFMDEKFCQSSRDSLIIASKEGETIICEIVMAEISTAFFRSGKAEKEILSFLSETGIELIPSSIEVFFKAGKAWNLYTSKSKNIVVCPKCGKNADIVCANCGRRIYWRQHIISDFLIGSHSVLHADRLLTRDRGYYKTYFPEIHLM